MVNDTNLTERENKVLPHLLVELFTSYISFALNSSIPHLPYIAFFNVPFSMS